jgi:hypothetical protein
VLRVAVCSLVAQRGWYERFIGLVE